MKTMRMNNQLVGLAGVSLLVVIWAFNYAHAPDYPDVHHLTPVEALALIETGRTLILDVREKDAFDKEHLPGALSVPIGELDSRMGEFEAHTAEEVVIYCNDGSTRGPRATDKMNKAGFTKAKNIESGLEGWRKAELPTVRQ